MALAAVAFMAVGAQPAPQRADPLRLDRGRFTALFYPAERVLATSLLDRAQATDTFPGLPRPTGRVILAIAPDRATFREWVGPSAPEWGAAVAFPESHRIIMQGRSAGADAGDPRDVFRHELAHLALHEALGDLPPRWFDEGYASYAAREWGREQVIAANLALALRGPPSFAELDTQLGEGATTAQNAYALAYRAVGDLAALDTAHGLSRLFENWRATGTLDKAMRVTYGMTLAGYEKQWQQQTRRRYGALALVGDVAVGGLFLIIVVVPLYLVRRQRDRARLFALSVADEASERAARTSAIDALLRGDEEGDFGAEPEEPPAS